MQIVLGVLVLSMFVGCSGTSPIVIEPLPATYTQFIAQSQVEASFATAIPSKMISNVVVVNPIATPASTVTPTLFKTMLPLIVSSPTATAIPQIYLPIGPGSSDVIPHQIVRARDDRLYLFSMQQFSPLIRVFTTNLSGFPNAASDFSLKTTVSEVGLPISIDAVYDGQDTIHILVNTKDTGRLLDYPFDIVSGVFRPVIQIASDSHKIAGYYIGTSGVSGIFDQNGFLQLAYWTANDRIRYLSLMYDPASNRLIQQGSDIILDNNGSSNHPVVALSPLDNTLYVSWVNTSGASTVVQLRKRAPDGSWGGVSTVSNALVWHSVNAGVNIDQGPSMLVDFTGNPYLAYIQDFDNSGSYGRIHIISQSVNGWLDQALPIYSHDPALAVNSRGEVYLIGHGHPNNQSCKSMDDMCVTFRNSAGSWTSPKLFAAHDPGTSFDGSPSVKWSVVGFNRPETIEFVFFQIPSGDYNNPTLYYGRLP